MAILRVLIASSTLIASSAAIAAPVDLDDLIGATATASTLRSVGINFDTDVQQSIGQVDAASTQGTIEARSNVDFESGTLRTRASHFNDGNTGNGNARANGVIFEAFQFSETRTVDFSLAIDGALTIDGTGDRARVSGGVNVFDITDFETILRPENERGVFGPLIDDLFSESSFLAAVSSGFDLQGSGRNDFVHPTDTLIDDAQGRTEFVDFSVDGSVGVTEGRTYLFLIEQISDVYVQGVSGGAEADFFSTAVFGFGDLGNTTYASASGTFLDSTGTLSQTIAPVPLPAGMPLLLGGLAAFGLIRRKRVA